MSLIYQRNQEGNLFLINICCGMYLPLITPYAQNSSMYDIPILPEAYQITPQWINEEMASLCGGAIIPELCVYITLQYDRIPSTTPGAEPPRDARDSGSARSHSTHLETSSSDRP